MVAADRVAQARARLEQILAAECADPKVAYYTRWWIGDDIAPTTVLLLHGLTNSPPQYDTLAPLLHARGHAVIVPRLPLHGYRDRMTDALAALRATDLEAAALEAVAIAALCGERVVVAGISIGATLAGWLAARTRIDIGIAFAPFCGLKELYGGLNDTLGAVLRALPNKFGWWDPRVKEKQPPSHGYPRFATRALGESLLLSTDIDRAPHAEHGRRAVLVLNANDPVVNNAHAHRRFSTLRSYGVDYERVVLQGLPKMHDVIEPLPQAHTELVYPALIDLIEA
ncbi:MAG TPA: alpha/beta fold hydrolase [Candidatus Elarobacter sp.]